MQYCTIERKKAESHSTFVVKLDLLYAAENITHIEAAKGISALDPAPFCVQSFPCKHGISYCLAPLDPICPLAPAFLGPSFAP